MSISNNVKKFNRDERGIGAAIIGFVSISVCLTLLFFLVEVGHVYLVKARIQNDMDFANGSTYSVLNMDKMAYGIYEYNSDSETKTDGYQHALDKYEQFLAENMKLNPATGAPANSKSDIAGPVSIEKFEVYLKEDLPMVNSDGYEIDKISVYSKIRVPIKNYFPMLFGDTYDAEVSRVTDLHVGL